MSDLVTLINALIPNVLLEELESSNSFTSEALTLNYKLDNQFELVRNWLSYDPTTDTHRQRVCPSYFDKYHTDTTKNLRALHDTFDL